MIIHNVAAKRAFCGEKYNAVCLAGSESAKVMLVCLEARQFIPAHAPGIDLYALVLEGFGMLCDGEHEERAGPGDMLFARAGERRGILAETALVLWAVVCPPPGPGDHKLLEQLLKQGRWCDDAPAK